MSRNPKNPSLWRYRVHLPALGGTLEVSAFDLLVACKYDDRIAMWSAEAIVQQEDAFEPREIEFLSPLANDNDELYGKYRFGMTERGMFYFRKRDVSQPSFQLRMRGQILQRSRVRIYYEVPAHERLDREYVMNALATIVGCPLPRQVVPFERE